MLFNSWQFAVFFPIVFLLYFALPHKYRWVMLLLASYWFYMSWDPELVVLIAFVTGLTYVCGRLLGRAEQAAWKRKLILAIGVLAPIGLLFYFKYFNFISSQVTALLQAWSLPVSERTLDIILPVGISFYTFQALSYVIDVYRNPTAMQTHVGYYALFISFFPQLVAGPIERTGDLMPQFFREHRFDYEDGVYGVCMIVWGLFKKIVVADTLSQYVELVYGGLLGREGLAYIIATAFFALQIYCDFSGYSDIAVGTARMLGFRLTRNFVSPYFSRSIGEFWRRWHISLSRWFRDYVYIPMGGNRVPVPRQCLNLMVTFLASGAWHGANWTFLIWGALYGVYSVVELLVRTAKKRNHRPTEDRSERWYTAALRTLGTLMLVCIGWVFFRANTVSDACYILSHMFDGVGFVGAYIRAGYIGIGVDLPTLLQILPSVAILTAFDYIQLARDPIASLRTRKPLVRCAVYVLFLLYVVMFSEKGIAAQFIYFRF